ncbi:VOC family protein [Phyllobacterium sp. K27]
MFSHIAVGSNDLAKSQTFYDALFAAMGGDSGKMDEKGRLVYIKEGRAFIVTLPIDGNTACHANGGTIGFTMTSPEMAIAWHDAGVKNGGTSIEEPPGVRHIWGRQFHIAYLRDPDGNKLCASHTVQP